jgi:Helitron helicase-like domain at N-terminus
MNNAPSAPSGDAFLDEFRDVDPWGEFSDLQPVPDSDSDRERRLTYIHFDHPLYLPLSYVLFYAEGGRGYSRGARLQGLTAKGKPFLSFLLIADANTSYVIGQPRIHDLLTIWAFYRYLTYTRKSSLNILHRGAALFQQYIVDTWLSIEMHRLEYYYFNQRQIRAELYDTARHQFLGDQDVSTTGRRIVLPAKFPGSVRNMQRSYQDSMAIVRTFGKPGYFITFTANPHWDEIKAELLTDSNGNPTQTWRDRPDLVSRVFRMKYDEMMQDLKKKGVLGDYVAHVSVIEYQKRGIPHAHILLWVKEPPNTPERIDQVISAEIPDVDGPGGQDTAHVGMITRNPRVWWKAVAKAISQNRPPIPQFSGVTAIPNTSAERMDRE